MSTASLVPPDLLLGEGVQKPPLNSGVFRGAKGAEETFGLNQLAPKAPEKIVDWPKAWKKIWPNLLRPLEGGRWVGPGGAPPPPQWCRVVKRSPVPP